MYWNIKATCWTYIHCNCNLFTHETGKGSKGGALVTTLFSRHRGRWSNLGVDAICIGWVCHWPLLHGSPSRPEKFFFGYSCFPLSSKSNTVKFQFDLECTDTFKRVQKNSSVSVSCLGKQITIKLYLWVSYLLILFYPSCFIQPITLHTSSCYYNDISWANANGNTASSDELF